MLTLNPELQDTGVAKSPPHSEVSVNEPNRHWHVTVTLAGREHDAELVRDALARLAMERPFLHSMRYRRNRAELQYWEQAEGMLDAASLALRLWNEHRDSAGLPEWEVVGLEVLERDTLQHRAHAGAPAMVGTPGAVPRPY